MSAFVVDNDHVNALLTWAVAEKASLWDRKQKQYETVTNDNADAFGQILMDENCRSYNYRYQGEEVDALDYAFKPFPVLLTPAEVIRACSCLDYQSCETPDYPESAACQIILELTNRAAHKLPAYKECEVWEVRGPGETQNYKSLTNYREETPPQKARRRA